MNAPDRSALLRALQAEDFALYEVALYLDGHPQNRRALAYFHEHKKLRDALRAEYEAAFGPLSFDRNQSTEKWAWTDGPWPWEREAN